MPKFLLLFCVLIILAFGLSAQPFQPLRLAEPSYGLDGSSVIQELNLFGGDLYANLQSFYDDEDAGLLSRIDPVTGAAIGICFPINTPTVRSVAERTAGNQIYVSRRDYRKGSSLYLIEEDQRTTKRLLQRDEREFRNYTELNGYTYFIADYVPKYGDAELAPPTFNNSRAHGAELWRTDGSPEGTILVHAFSAALLNSITFYAGSTKLLIVGAEPVFDVVLSRSFVYDSVEEELLTFPNGQTSLSIPVVPSNYFEYAEGYFYFGIPGTSVRGGSVLIINEEFLSATSTNLPVVEVNGREVPEYRDMKLARLKDSVYLVAYRTEEPVGYDLFRVRPGEQVSFVPLGEPMNVRVTADIEISPVVSNDTLYFISPLINTFAYLRSFHPSDTVPRMLAELRLSGDYAFCQQAGRYVYITNREPDYIIRYDLVTGDDIRLNATFPPLKNGEDFSDPLRVTDAGAYFMSAEDGLRFWPAGENTDTEFGNFVTPTNSRRPQLWHPVDGGASLLLNTNRLNLVSTADGTIFPVEDGGVSEDNELRALTHNSNHSIFTAHPRTGGRLEGEYVFKLENNQLIPTPITFNEELVTSTSYLSLAKENTDGRAAVYFRQRFRSDVFSIAEPGPAGDLKISSILMPEYSFPRRIFDSTFFAIKQVGEEWSASLFDYDGNVLRTAAAGGLCNVQAVTEQRMFAVCPDFSADVLKFHLLATADQEETIFTSDDNLMIPYNSDAFFAINERVVFVADHDNFGVEWFVANDTTGDIRLLRDISPGPDFGTTFDGPVYHDGDRGVYFLANDGVHGTELWFTDGSPDGTSLVNDINPGPGSSDPKSFMANGRSLYFSARGALGEELYHLNLEDRSVELFVDLAPGTASSWPYGFRVVDGDFYFLGRAAAGQHHDLYTLDLSVSTTSSPLTELPARVYPNPAGQYPVTIDAPAGETFTALELLNVAGQKLRNLQASGNRITISIEDLPPGTYWLRAHYVSGRHSINPVIR
jgi:ELWxxDGT repeat protein